MFELLKQRNFPLSKDKNNYHKQGTEFSKSCPGTLFNLSDFDKKKVEIRFSLEKTSNDGGVLLLKEVDNQIGLIDRLSACIKDGRHQGYIKHSIRSMLRQRIMQIAASYEDANDCNALIDDVILKVCDNQQQPLATQPTMCRFKNQSCKLITTIIKPGRRSKSVNPKNS